jgi:hypothetical protein
MQVFRTIKEVRDFKKKLPFTTENGKLGVLGFVPTMGYLHEGFNFNLYYLKINFHLRAYVTVQTSETRSQLKNKS